MTVSRSLYVLVANNYYQTPELHDDLPDL